MQASTVVGYNTITVPATYHMGFGVQFTDVSGASQSIKVTDLLGGYTPTASGNWAFMDQIWVWNTTDDKWNMFGYRQGKQTRPTGWWLYDNQASSWVREVADTDVVSSGEGFYLYNAATTAKTITLSGAIVPLTETKTFTIAPTYHAAVAYPWPIEIKVSDLFSYLTAGTVTASGNWAFMDQVWVWNTTADKWDMFGYRQGKNARPTGWWLYDNQAGSWIREMADTDVITPGKMVYLYNAGTEPKTFEFTAKKSEE